MSLETAENAILTISEEDFSKVSKDNDNSKYR
jgi:hypothetical protein